MAGKQRYNAGPQPSISRQLAYRRCAGIMEGRSERTQVDERVVVPFHLEAAQILRERLEWLKDDEPMQTDRVRLNKACCIPLQYAIIEGVPIHGPIDTVSCEAC